MRSKSARIRRAPSGARPRGGSPARRAASGGTPRPWRRSRADARSEWRVDELGQLGDDLHVLQRRRRMPGRWTFTATGRPSRSVARWTWPREAEPTAAGSKLPNAEEMRTPSSSSTTCSATPARGARRRPGGRDSASDTPAGEIGAGGQQLAELDEGRAHADQLVDEALGVVLGGGVVVLDEALQVQLRLEGRPGQGCAAVLEQQPGQGEVARGVAGLQRRTHLRDLPRGDAVPARGLRKRERVNAPPGSGPGRRSAPRGRPGGGRAPRDWSGRTTTRQPASRSMPRRSKTSSSVGSGRRPSPRRPGRTGPCGGAAPAGIESTARSWWPCWNTARTSMTASGSVGAAAGGTTRVPPVCLVFSASSA